MITNFNKTKFINMKFTFMNVVISNFKKPSLAITKFKSRFESCNYVITNFIITNFLITK